MTVEIRFSVMSPEGRSKSVSGPGPGFSSSSLARRLDTLENKTVYLVDTGFGGSSRFMLQIQKWFKEHQPSVTTIRKRKPGNVFMDDNTELWEEIKTRGQAVVIGVGG
jgi:hypothetical protein